METALKKIAPRLMYYRRKILLALLGALNREVTKTAFQKYLFLVSDEQEKPAYDFVPYRFGCFSFQADADKKTLTKYGYLKDQDKWALSQKQHFLHLLESNDREAIYRVVDRVGKLSNRKLIRYVYRKYPYYAINSEIRCDILNDHDQKQVDSAWAVPHKSKRLFTIGYEGQSLERYLNRLIEEDIRVLCDVRRNPVSMKFGFSKRKLQNAVQGLGIRYVHMPELGIESIKRRELNSPDDYRKLFKEYTGTTLANNTGALQDIMELVNKYHRVALTCFEADHNSCHRSCVADALLRHRDFHHHVAHI